jgi:ribosomal protein L11 methyltransferase
MEKFLNVHLKIYEVDYEILVAYLSEMPFCGIEERYDELIVTFNVNDYNDDIRNEIKENLESFNSDYIIIKEEMIDDKNWNEEWENQIEPIIINDDIVITPDWKQDQLNHKLKLLINPKMSFGTGHHATTRLVCRMCLDVITPDTFWVDAGTGTGVLAILAAKLGAKPILAFDNNMWSIDNAKENVLMNDVEDIVKVELADIDEFIIPECDGILANLFRHLLIDSFPKFYQALKNKNGDLLVSGILVYDKEEIIEHALKNGFKLIKEILEDDWTAIHFRA